MGAFALVVSLSFLAGAVPAVAKNQILPLEEARKQLIVADYSSAERQLLANQAEFMIRSLYVHRELKIQEFGKKVDPLPRLLEVKRRAGLLSNEELQRQLWGVFTDLHDLHTNYY